MKQEKPFDDARDLLIKRLIPAEPEVLFKAWTQAELLKKWWGPAGVTCTEAEVDLRVGGKFRIANQLPTGKLIWIHGVFEVIEAPTLLQYSWAVGLDSEPTERVTVRFEKVGGGTEIVLLHENAPTPDELANHIYGWKGCLDGLDEFVSEVAS